MRLFKRRHSFRCLQTENFLNALKVTLTKTKLAKSDVKTAFIVMRLDTMNNAVVQEILKSQVRCVSLQVKVSLY